MCAATVAVHVSSTIKLPRAARSAWITCPVRESDLYRNMEGSWRTLGQTRGPAAEDAKYLKKFRCVKKRWMLLKSTRRPSHHECTCRVTKATFDFLNNALESHPALDKDTARRRDVVPGAFPTRSALLVAEFRSRSIHAALLFCVYCFLP